MNNNERDSFISCRTIDTMNETIEAEMQEILERPEKMETRLTACVDLKVDNGIRATREKKYKSFAEVLAVETKEASNAPTPRAPSKTMSHMDLIVQKSVRSQGVPEDPERSKADNLVPMTKWVNGKFEGMGVTSHVTELRQIRKFACNKKQLGMLMPSLWNEHDAKSGLSKSI